MRRTLIRFENRSPSKLSSSDESRASPSPTIAMPSSMAISVPSRHQSIAPPPCVSAMPATTSSMISLPTHSTESGISERIARSIRIAAVYPRCVP